MKYLRWLNPIWWFWLLYGAVRTLRIVRGSAQCEDCEIGARGEMPDPDDLCDYHQARFDGLAGESWREKWRRRWGS